MIRFGKSDIITLLCYCLANNHSFNDGNKRVGVLSMAMFLEYNGRPIDCTDDDLECLGLGVASGQLSQADILEWIYQKTSKY